MDNALFPRTDVTAIMRARSNDPAQREQAWRDVAAVYHRPIYLHLRLKWRKSPAEAEDMTQLFFLRAIEKDALAAYEPTLGRFRSYVRISVDRLVMSDHAARHTLKRGGGVAPIDADISELEAAVRDAAAVDPEGVFEAEWQKSVLAASIARLASQLTAEGRSHLYEAFQRYDLAEEPTSYEEVARAMGVAVTDVTNYLATARRRFRAAALEVLAELTVTEQEMRAEALELFGPGAPR